MRTILKYAAAATLTGALALAAMTPSEARDGRNAAAAIGFGAGALVGAAAANAANNGYYGSGYSYYDEPAYAYEPAPVYVEPYAYQPAPVYRYRGWNGGKDQSIRSQ